MTKPIEFQLAALALVGKLPEKFDKELAELVEDCEQRPAIKKARKLILEVQLKPKLDNGEVEGVYTEFRIRSTRPERTTGQISMQIRRKRNQRVLAFMAEDEIDMV